MWRKEPDMYDLLLKNGRLLDGSRVDIAIKGGRFSRIAESLPSDSASESFDCGGVVIMPPFYNCHTHAAMVLFRGYADDLPLFPWLNDHIWPAEARLTGDDVYHAVRLAILEMVKSGTVFFNDSYFFLPETIRAVEEMGTRACIGLLWLNVGNVRANEIRREENKQVLSDWKAGRLSPRVTIACDPHSIYTVPEAELREIAEDSLANDLLMHMHLAETRKEFDDCRNAHDGMTPLEYADYCGLVNDRARFAHAVWMTESDLRRAAEAGAVLVSNPTSNMKLCSGMFHFQEAERAGCRIALGTDGCASNNAHSFFSEMKIAALVGKLQSMDPTVCPAAKVLETATQAADYFVPGAGRIEEGALADAILINTDQPYFIGDYNIVSNLVYAGESSCVDSMICDGKFVMKHRHVAREEEIMENARRVCAKFRR